MDNPSNSSHIESFEKNRPPFFTGTGYPYWKTKMTWFLQSTDLYIWNVIENEPTFPSKLVDGVMVPKPSKNGMSMIEKNFN